MRTLFICIALYAVVSLQAQSFHFAGNSPFNLKSTNAQGENQTMKVFFIDLDHDGDLDVLHIGVSDIDDVYAPREGNVHYFIEKQMNTGSKTVPVFGVRTTYSSSFPFPTGYFLPAIGDVNDDGHVDMIIGSEIESNLHQQVLYYRNTGTSLNPQYQTMNATEMNLDIFVPGSLFFPELIDLDRDNDLDIVMSGHSREFVDAVKVERVTIKYAKNIGTQNAPQFLGWFEEPFNMKTHGIGEMFLIGGDIDLDGDPDLLGQGLFDGASLFYFENEPTFNGKPYYLFPQLSPFGLPMAGTEEQLIFPTLADLDGDKDLDLFVTRIVDENYVLEYYQNDLASGITEPGAQDLLSIQPQPVADQLTVIAHDGQSILNMKIMNLTGQVVMDVNAPKFPVMVSDLPPAIYILELKLENGTYRREVVKM